ncbi:MAG: hypothetical protein CM1200mP29_06290 [Verrucomicrobiota bacterium]|nr:MAG: hypothetical protein CM1200mP29_06290 [Verrucomicrobiota bacterium]
MLKIEVGRKHPAPSQRQVLEKICHPSLRTMRANRILPPLIQHSKQEGDSLVIYCDNCTQKTRGAQRTDRQGNRVPGFVTIRKTVPRRERAGAQTDKTHRTP